MSPAADADRLALGRRLKDSAYAAMYTDLAQAEAATAQIAALAGQAEGVAARRELQALADWVAGAAQALQGQAALALQRLDAAGAAFDALGLSREAAASQVPKIAALAMLGRHDDALACAEHTLAQLDAAGDAGTAGKVEINLGSMLLRQDRYADAQAHYRRAAVRLARVGDRRYSVMADIGLAGALSWQYQFDEALRIYERADARAQAHGLDNLKGVIHSSRGLLELRRGRHADALRWLESALREAEAHGPPQRLADARAELADAYLALNLLPEAASLYERAIAGCRDNDAPIEQAWATAQLALTQARQGQVPAALGRFEEARALFSAQGNGVGAAWLDMQAAALRLAEGDAQGALAQADAAARALADAGMRGWRLEARALGGEALAALGRRRQAWERLLAVLADADGLPELQARCQVALGGLQQHEGDRTAARARYESAVEAIDSQQAALHDDEFRTAYRAGRQAPFDALIGIALDDGDPAALLRAMERAHARALQLGLARSGSADAEASAAWREPLHWLQQQWQQAVAAGEGERAALLQARARELEAEALQAHRRSQGARASAAHAAATDQAAFAPEQVQARLDARSALVAYAWAGERLAVVVVRHDRLHHAELDTRGLEERIAQLRFQIDTLRFGGALLRSAHSGQIGARAQAHLRALHDQLWAPIVPWLAGAQHVTVVPHRALHYLPFCALHDGDLALLDRHAIACAASAALWSAAAPRPPRAAGRALVVGIGGEALPHVAAEVEGVAAALGPGTIVLQGEDATLARLRDALAGGVDRLHLACHGQFRADSPYFSSLALADGALTLRDAAALPLTDTFVALSACETGMSRVAPGDELLGLLRGFLLAGAPAVMCSLWTVDDAGTAGLMTRFYRDLVAGEAAAQALRRAQQALRAEQPHPYHWAPFVLHGRV